MTKLIIKEVGVKGDGLAQLDGGHIFVDRALAQETVDAKIYKTKDGISRASVVSIETASPDRNMKPPCPYYDTCGGCQMQHMHETAYRKWKEEKVLSLLQERLGTLPEVIPTHFTKTHSRRRSTFAVMKQNKKLTLGYHQRRSKIITDIENCLILDPDIMALSKQIKPYLLDIVRDSRVCDIFIQKIDSAYDLVITGPVGKKGEPDLTVRQACAQLIQETAVARISWRERDRHTPEILLEKHPLIKKTGALHVPLPPLAFLQPSDEGETALSDRMLSFLPKQPPSLKCADLFSGNGTFTGVLVKNGHDVHSYESDQNAINALKKASFSKVFLRNLFKNPLEKKEINTFDVIVLDPPRAGAKEQAKHLSQSEVQTIIYISCNPASFSRDAKILIDDGEYKLKKLQIIDQFPWSTHAELIALFEKS